MIIVLPQKMDNKETEVKKILELPPAPPPITPSHIIGIRIQLIGKCLPIFSPFCMQVYYLNSIIASINWKEFTNQGSQREIVEKVCEDLPHISIAIPVYYHQEGGKRDKK